MFLFSSQLKLEHESTNLEEVIGYDMTRDQIVMEAKKLSMPFPDTCECMG